MRSKLLLSLQRGLLGAVHPQLREASIEADEQAKIIRLRFEYDGEPEFETQESCSCVATECIADFPSPWQLEEQHMAVPHPSALQPLKLIAFLRYEAKGDHTIFPAS
jgi:hypothetical protein